MSGVSVGCPGEAGPKTVPDVAQDELGVEKVHFNDNDDEVTGCKTATRPRAAPRCRIKVTLFSVP